MRYLLLFIPFLLFAVEPIIKYENVKPYYYPNQKVNIKLKIVLPIKERVKVVAPEGVEYNFTKVNPFVYYLNLEFLAKKSLPDIVVFGTKTYADINLSKIINTIPLTPPKFYSDVVADNLYISNVVTSSYDKNYNIVSFNIRCVNCDVRSFKLGLKDEKLNILTKEDASYVGLVPKGEGKLVFYYFKLPQEKFTKVSINLNPKEELISTQIKVTPEEDTFFTPLNIILLTAIVILSFLFIIARLYLLLAVPLAILIYLLYIVFPKGSMWIQKGTKVQILPTPQSTIIYIAPKEEQVFIIKRDKKYTKIRVNNKIGWIKNENN